MYVNIAELETLETIPHETEYARTGWDASVTIGEKYGSAFVVDDRETADLTLMMLVAHRLQFGSVIVKNDKGFPVGQRKMTWREAFAEERVCLAWYALAKDERPHLYSGTGTERVENRTHREFVWRWYRAELPASVARTHEPDILDRVHARNEREASKKGEHYQRKVKKSPPPEDQQSLF